MSIDYRATYVWYVYFTQSEASGGEVFTVKEGDIVVDTYFGVSALIHNSSNLGFFKRRGAINWWPTFLCYTCKYHRRNTYTEIYWRLESFANITYTYCLLIILVSIMLLWYAALCYSLVQFSNYPISWIILYYWPGTLCTVLVRGQCWASSLSFWRSRARVHVKHVVACNVQV